MNLQTDKIHLPVPFQHMYTLQHTFTGGIRPRPVSISETFTEAITRNEIIAYITGVDCQRLVGGDWMSDVAIFKNTGVHAVHNCIEQAIAYSVRIA